MCKTIRSNINCFKIIRKCLTRVCTHVFKFYDSFPFIVLSETVWSQTSQTTLKPIKSLYNRALKVFDQKPIRFHHHILLKHNFLSLPNFINFSILKLFFKCVNGLAPKPLSSCISKLQSCSRSTRAASAGDCIVPFRKTCFAQTAFSVRGTSLWNMLPVHLKSVTKLGFFKKETKTWIFQQQQRTHV